VSRKIIAFSWYGGKTSQLNWLLPIIDSTPHSVYVESFGGSAAVLLNKKPSPVEVYNDLYSDVVNFFFVLRTQRDELLSLLDLTPYSREEFANSLQNQENDSSLERARKFFVKARQVRTGLATTASAGRWAYVVNHSRRGMSQMVSRWLSAIDGLEQVCSRLKEIQLENLEAIDLIGRYDREDTLHYVDPPYLMDTRSGGVGYAHELTESQHIELLEKLKTLKGKVILSGYPNDIYNQILAGWFKYNGDSKMSASTRQTGNPSLRQEVIWTNYELNNDLLMMIAD
jgi:DNA adenine methylase